MMIDITGKTRLFAVLGDPVEQVRAPSMLNGLFAQLDIDAVLVPIQVHPDHLTEVVRGLQNIGNLDGLLVTVPHKIAVCQCADELSPAATLVGSANALRRNPDGRWFADNFDGIGFVSGLRSAGHDPHGKRVALAGAGGAGASIAAALLEAGVPHLSIHDPHMARLSRLLANLEQRWPGRVIATAEPLLGQVDMAINATPLGMNPHDPLPFTPEALPRDCLVAEIIMSPQETPLLRAAAALGNPVHHGMHMLDQQLDLYRAFFHLGHDSASDRISRTGQIHVGL